MIRNPVGVVSMLRQQYYSDSRGSTNHYILGIRYGIRHKWLGTEFVGNKDFEEYKLLLSASTGINHEGRLHIIGGGEFDVETDTIPSGANSARYSNHICISE